jgi:hypothetical protein
MRAQRKLWTDAWQLGLDAQRVIALRVARISAGGPAEEAESRRMVSEKIAAAGAAQLAAVTALTAGKTPETVARAALDPVIRTVRANRLRLSRAERVDSLLSWLQRLLPGASHR